MPALRSSRSSRMHPFKKTNRGPRQNIKSFRSGYRTSISTVERKYVDQANSISINLAGSVNFISGLNQGNDNFERQGRRVTWKDVAARFLIDASQLNSTSTTNMDTTMRVIVFLDTQNTGTLPLITDVLQGGRITSHLNLGNAQRFKIVVDYIEALSAAFTPNLVSGTNYPVLNEADPNLVRKFYRKLPNVVGTYQGTTNALADSSGNQLFLLVIGEDAVAADNFRIQINTRCKFTDD